MGKCLKKTYTNNDVVKLSRPIVCYGFHQIKQPVCEHLETCLKDNGLYIKVTKSGRKRVKEIKNV